MKNAAPPTMARNPTMLMITPATSAACVKERPAQKGSGSGEDAGAVGDGDHVGAVPDTKFAADPGQVAFHGQW